MAADWLLDNQNDDGGWGYAPGKRSSMEPTAWALLAVLPAPAAAERVRRAVAWVRSRQSADGAFAATDQGAEGAWTGSLALLALARAGADGDARKRGLARLLDWSGMQLPVDPNNDLDGSLRGWPWIDGTFSWVEPTAFALMALKIEGRRSDPRVEEAERMLIDRQCIGGGWNYGNRRVLDEPLVPFDQVTAKVLVALQDRQATPELHDTARAACALDLRKHHSTVTRAWLALARGLWGHDLSADERAAVAENLVADRELNIATLASAMAELVVCWPTHAPLRFA